MAFDDFHCIVIGNEPAGLWLLCALDRAYRELQITPRLGWIPQGGATRPVHLPTAFASSLGIEPRAPWAVEFVTPNETITWNKRTVSERYADLQLPQFIQDPLVALTAPNKEEKLRTRRAILQSPELVGYAQGLWKLLGRAEELLPETLVHYARYFTSLQTWQAIEDLPASIERIEALGWQGDEVGVRAVAGRGLSLRFPKYEEICSEKWVLNCDTRSLLRAFGKSPKLLDLLEVQPQTKTISARYSLTLTLQKCTLPCPVPPGTLLFETDSIPDPHTEILPLTLSESQGLQELALWVDGPAKISLEAISDRFKTSLGRVNRLFPFLAGSVLETSMPLGIESCFDSEYRRQIEDRLQLETVELFQNTILSPRTRSKALFHLMPQLGSQLPYPLGTLKTARELVTQFIGTKRPASPIVEPPNPSP